VEYKGAVFPNYPALGNAKNKERLDKILKAKKKSFQLCQVLKLYLENTI
jgi:hypothetical protein